MHPHQCSALDLQGDSQHPQTPSCKLHSLQFFYAAVLLLGWIRPRQFQSPKSVDMNNKRTTSQKGGKDWVLVNFSVQNQHIFHETHGKGNSSFNFSKNGLNAENLTSAQCFLFLRRLSFCCSIQHFRATEVLMSL